MSLRKHTSKDTETDILRKSRRRCPLCFHLDSDSGEKVGQIAHLDQDPSNNVEDNLCFLCLPHHTLYDSKASQHKNYTLREVKSWRKDLYATLEKLEVNPSATASPRFEQQTARIQHQRDVETLNTVLGFVHWPTLDEHVSSLPHVMIDPIFHFYEGFHAFYTSSLFHLYDSTLAAEMAALHSSWDITVSFGIHYRQIANGNYLFDNPNHRPFSIEQERDWEKIQQAASALSKAKKSVLNQIRSDYVEIEVGKLSNKAWNEFCKYRELSLR